MSPLGVVPIQIVDSHTLPFKSNDPNLSILLSGYGFRMIMSQQIRETALAVRVGSCFAKPDYVTSLTGSHFRPIFQSFSHMVRYAFMMPKSHCTL